MYDINCRYKYNRRQRGDCINSFVIDWINVRIKYLYTIYMMENGEETMENFMEYVGKLKIKPRLPSPTS